MILRNVRNRVVSSEHVHSGISVPPLVVLMLLLLHRLSAVELMMWSAAHYLLGVIHGVGHEMLAGIESVHDLLRLGKLNHRLLHVVQASLDQNLLFLVEVEQIIPQLLLAQHLWVADDDDAVFSACQSDV